MKQDQHSFSTKWSSRIEREGFTSIPNVLLKHQRDLEMSNGELTVLSNLLLHMWDSNMPYPSAGTISKHSGMAINTIRTHLRSLEKKGIIQRKYRRAQTNMYNLQPLKFKLERLVSNPRPIPTQKLTPIYSNPVGYPSPYSDTNKEAEKKTQRKRRSDEMGITSIKTILDSKVSNNSKG